MAKSKAEKQADALARKREYYVKVHLADFIRWSPIGPCWENDVAHMTDFIQAIANLQRLSEEAGIQMTGGIGWHSVDTWPVKEIVKSLLHDGTVHHFVSDCNANRMRAGFPPISVEPVECWGTRFGQVQELLKHPKVVELINFL